MKVQALMNELVSQNRILGASRLVGASRLRLETLVRLRWLGVCGQTATVIAVHWGLGFSLPIALCLAVVAVSAWLNVFLRFRYAPNYRLPSGPAALILGFDLVELVALLYLTGGLENPFSLLLLVPVMVSASTQPPRTTLVLGAAATLGATALTLTHLPLPWYPGAAFNGPFVYVAGTWFAIVSGMAFVGLYAWRIADEARKMSEALAAAEIVMEREQKLLALNGLAAAAAHGLGTPLATITVASKELLRAIASDDPHREDIELVNAQARRCREILAELTEQSARSETLMPSEPLRHLLEDVAEPNRGFGVAVKVIVGAPDAGTLTGNPDEALKVYRNPALVYGLGNIVENAVDFAASLVEIHAAWSAAEVVVSVVDDGPGVALDVLERLGEPFISTRAYTTENAAGGSLGDAGEVGMGLGFFIAKTFLERSGATLTIENRRDGATGAAVRVVWPRETIESQPLSELRETLGLGQTAD